MNYVKHLSLALLVIGASPVIFAMSDADKAAAAAQALADKAAADKVAADKAAKDLADKATADKATADKLVNADSSWTNKPWVHYNKQSTAVKVAIPVAVAGTAFALAYYFIPEVKKATHKAIDKTKAFGNEVMENPEGSTARRTALIAAGLLTAGAVVCVKWDVIKRAISETTEEKTARLAKEAKDAEEAVAKKAKDLADKAADKAKDLADKAKDKVN